MIDYTLSDGVLTIKDGTKNILIDAFSNNIQIKKVIIPNSVREIGRKAFNLCYNLEEVVIPKRGLRFIGDNAFYCCFKLARFDIPSLNRVIL